MTRYLLFLFVILICSFSCSTGDGNANELLNRYNIKLELDPAEQHIKVVVDLQLFSRNSDFDSLLFYLHRQLDIQKLSGENISGYIYDEEIAPPGLFMPDSKPLLITFDRAVLQNESVNLHFEYSGSISEWPEWSANVIGEDWVEIGLYFPWFPYCANPDILNSFTYDVEVVCDSSYKIKSFGSSEEIVQEPSLIKWRFKNNYPVNDIVITASKRFKTVSTGNEGFPVNIHYNFISENSANMLAQELTGIIDRYGGWFGEASIDEITLIESLRSRGGGYSRPGLIVLGGLNEENLLNRRENFIRYIAHESAHLWWRGAPTNSWEDWLNEGLAEYSALMFIREEFGIEAFDIRISGKMENSAGTSPVWGFEREDMSTPEKRAETEKILYDKVPVILNELENAIGTEAFISLCNEVLTMNELNVNNFLKVLNYRHNDHIRNWFELLLMTR